MKGEGYAQERPADPADQQQQQEKWTKDEHEVFLQAVHLFGREWNRISEYMGTKTVAQVKAHAYAQFSKIQNGKSKGLVPPKQAARPAPYPDIPRPFPLLSPGDVMLRNYAERAPVHHGPPPPHQPGARLPPHVAGLPHMMMAQSAMMEQERMKAYQNHVMMHNYLYQSHMTPQFPAHLVPPPPGSAAATAAAAAAATSASLQSAAGGGSSRQHAEERQGKTEKRRRERGYDDGDNSEVDDVDAEDEYDPDEEYDDDSDAPSGRRRSKGKEQPRARKQKRRTAERANGHGNAADNDDDDDDNAGSQSDEDSRSRDWSASKNRAKRDRRRDDDEHDGVNGNSPSRSRSAVMGGLGSHAAPAPPSAAATTARAKAVDSLRLNAADAISPDLQHMLQMQGQQAGGHESMLTLGSDAYGHAPRAYAHPSMLAGPQFEMMRHHPAAGYPGSPYPLAPGHAAAFGSAISHVADPLHHLHPHGRFPIPDFLRRPGGMPPPPGELYRVVGSGAAIPKAEGAWSSSHAQEEMSAGGLYGGMPHAAAGLGASDPLMAHSRAALTRAHEDALNRSRLAALPPTIPHSIPELARRTSPTAVTRTSTPKEEPTGSSNDVSDDRDDYSNKKKRERWTQEEHELFLKGLELYGRKWTKIQALIPNKTVTQVRTHAYGYFAKLLRRVPNEQDLLEVAHIMSGMRNREGEEEDDEEGGGSHGSSKTSGASKATPESAVPRAAPAQAAASTPQAAAQHSPTATAPASASQSQVGSNSNEESDDDDAIVDSKTAWDTKTAQSEKRDGPPSKGLQLLAKYAGDSDKGVSGDDVVDEEEVEDDDEGDLESDEERRALEAIRSIARRGGEQPSTAARTSEDGADQDSA